MKDLYLDLLKRTLTGMVYKDPAIPVPWRPSNLYDAEKRAAGRDWPMHAHTMIGLKRLDNLQACIASVMSDGVPGDFIETGVWRGGACIFMRGMLKQYFTNRIVYVADSFCGFPAHPSHEGDLELIAQPEQKFLSVSLEEVSDNFELYGLLDDQVQFIPGWFSESLPGPVKQLAILRLDGDLYDSTLDAMFALYPLLSPGGYCIVDDWNIGMCREAVRDYRDHNSIDDEIIDIDGHSVYWRKYEADWWRKS